MDLSEDELKMLREALFSWTAGFDSSYGNPELLRKAKDLFIKLGATEAEKNGDFS